MAATADLHDASDLRDQRMRYVTQAFQESTLERGRPLEQFLGGGFRDGEPIIRVIELRPTQSGDVEIWLHEARDLGNQDPVDYDPFIVHRDDDETAMEFAATGLTPREALDLARTRFGATDTRWTNEGVSQDEYLDFIRAGRPARWP